MSIKNQITQTSLKDQAVGSSTYVDQLQSTIGGSNIANQVFQNTNLDIENTKPNGGPLNDPASGFKHIYVPSYKYEDNKPG